MTIRTDASLSRVTAARLVATSAVLGGALALAGLGAFGNLADGPADGSVGIVTVELAQPLSQH